MLFERNIYLEFLSRSVVRVVTGSVMRVNFVDLIAVLGSVLTKMRKKFGTLVGSNKKKSYLCTLCLTKIFYNYAKNEN